MLRNVRKITGGFHGGIGFQPVMYAMLKTGRASIPLRKFVILAALNVIAEPFEATFFFPVPLSRERRTMAEQTTMVRRFVMN